MWRRRRRGQRPLAWSVDTGARVTVGVPCSPEKIDLIPVTEVVLASEVVVVLGALVKALLVTLGRAAMLSIRASAGGVGKVDIELLVEAVDGLSEVHAEVKGVNESVDWDHCVVVSSHDSTLVEVDSESHSAKPLLIVSSVSTSALVVVGLAACLDSITPVGVSLEIDFDKVGSALWSQDTGVLDSLAEIKASSVIEEGGQKTELVVLRACSAQSSLVD